MRALRERFGVAADILIPRQPEDRELVSTVADYSTFYASRCERTSCGFVAGEFVERGGKVIWGNAESGIWDVEQDHCLASSAIVT